MADRKAVMEPAWFRVCLNTIVRKGVNLESERLRILPMGSRVRVISREKRRVQIDQPIKGWCSLKSSNGDTILTPLDQSEIAQATPKGNNIKKKWDRKTKKAREEVDKYTDQEREKQKILSSDEQAKNLYELTKELKMLKQQVQQKQMTEAERKKNETELEKTKEAVNSLKQNTVKKQEEIEALEAKIEKLAVDEKTRQKVAELQTMEEQKAAADKKLKVAKSLAQAAKREMDEMQQQFKNMFAQGEDKDDEYEPGDVLMVRDGLGVVVVKFYGKVDGMNNEKFLGVELSDPIGDTNGTVNGKKYFEVRDEHGLFIRKDQVKKKILPEQLLKQLHATLRKVQRSKSAKE